MVDTVIFLPEPELRFGFGQCTPHPKDGLLLFGPETNPLKSGVLRIGVVGTDEGFSRLKRWIRTVSGPVMPKEADNPNHTLFPGFVAVFGATLPTEPAVFLSVVPMDIHKALYQGDRYQAIHDTVSVYANPIVEFLRRGSETTVDLWFAVIPEEVYQLGRPESRVTKDEVLASALVMDKKAATKILETPSLFEEDNVAADLYRFKLNFHNQLKARLLEHRVALQVVRETTLTPEDFLNKVGQPKRRLQDPATLAWNLTTTAFFKAGGRPWRLAAPRPGVCYVGVVFKRDLTGPEVGNACCGAQMFLDSGDGVVFRGAVGPWYSLDKREYHLPRDKAAEMLGLVVNEYKKTHGGDVPKELFVHGKTYFNDEEWAGFRDTIPSSTALTCVRIRREMGLKVFRRAENNVPRGLAIVSSTTQGRLISTGFVPRLQTYPGREESWPQKTGQGDKW